MSYLSYFAGHRRLWPVPAKPKPTGIVVLDQLPRNAAGKVLKHELRVWCGRSRSQNGGSSE